MFDKPKTIEEARKCRYDCSSIRPNGIPYEEGRCAYEVSDGTGWHRYQCSRKNGKGLSGLYCGIHVRKLQL